MSAILSVVSAAFWGILLLSVLVFVHEGGHFLSARAFGMRVTEFFLGMPCRLKLSHRSKSRGTEVGVTPVLLGGYTRICGMDGDVTARTAAVLGCVMRHGRASVADVAAEVGCDDEDALAELALLCDWASLEPYFDPELGEHEGQKDWPQAFQTVRRDANLLTAFDAGHDFSLEGSTAAGSPQPIPADDPQAFLESERSRTYQGKGFVARFVTLLAGPAVNIVTGLVLLACVVGVGGLEVARNVNVVGTVSDGSLAQAVGIEPGDTISSVAGTPCSDWVGMGDSLRDAISEGEPFEVVVDRDGSSRTVTVDPSQLSSDGLFGINAPVETYHPGPVQSLGISWGYVAATASFVVELLQPAHTAEVVSQSSSVLGISAMAAQAASSGARDFLFLMAGISLSLGFMNLIPLPPLDGGKILIEVVQLVSRRRLSSRIQNGLSYAGLALVLLLFFVAVRQDVIRFVLGG